MPALGSRRRLERTIKLATAATTAPTTRTTRTTTRTLLVLFLLVLFTPTALAYCQDVNPNDPTAKDPVNNWKEPCDRSGNDRCNSCFLFVHTSKPLIGKHKFAYAHTKAYRAKILPTKAVTGLESIVNSHYHSKDDEATFDLWKTGLDAARTKGGLPGVTHAASHPIIYVNSLHARTQHQLHAHCGQAVNKDWYNCAKPVYDRPPQKHGEWVTLEASAACDKLSASKASVVVRATTSSANGVNEAIRQGFKKMLLKETGGGKSITSNAAALRTGVLVAPSGGGGGKGGDEMLVFLVTGSNDYKVFGDATF